MAKKSKRRVKRASWTKSNLAELRKYSKDKLPVKKISRLMKRTALPQGQCPLRVNRDRPIQRPFWPLSALRR